MAEETLAQVDAQKTQSAEDSIADFIFGKEEPEQPEEELAEAGPNVQVEGEDESEEPEEEVEAKEEEPEGPEFVEVEINGTLYEVPKEISDGYMLQADYTQKTQAVSAQRKELEVMQGTMQQMQDQYEFTASIQNDVMKAQQLEQQAEQAHKYLRDNIDNLSSTDIEKIRLAVEDARNERDTIVNDLKGKQAEFQQAQEQTRQELLNKGTEVLRTRIPGWDEAKAKQVREFAIDSGYSEQEIESVIDPRMVETLWMASQYKSLKDNAAPVAAKVKDAPAIKPKSRNPMPESKKQELKLRKQLKSEKLSDYEKANLIGQDIAGKFF